MKHMNKLFLLFPFLVLGCAEGDNQSFWQALSANLLEIVVLVATPIILLLVRKLVQVLEDKLGIDVADKHEALMSQLVMKGIAYAHEQGRKALKEGKPPVAGDEKKIMAVEFVADQLERMGATTFAADKLEKLVEAHLNLERDPEDTTKPAS